MYKGKCRRKGCNKDFQGFEPWHKDGFCSFKHQIEQIDDNMDRIGESIGHSMGEFYNPEFHRR